MEMWNSLQKVQKAKQVTKNFNVCQSLEFYICLPLTLGQIIQTYSCSLRTNDRIFGQRLSCYWMSC